MRHQSLHVAQGVQKEQRGDQAGLPHDRRNGDHLWVVELLKQFVLYGTAHFLCI